MDENELFVIFDEYPRYKIVEQVAEFIRRGSEEKKLRVLEIGANAHKHLRLFLPQDEILFTDIELTQEMENDPEFQQADGTALPFEDGSFDLVVATDVLEHVPADKRAALLSEAYRVAKMGAVITFPHDTEDVRAAEERVNQFYKSVNGEDYIWLKEHAMCGLPDTEAIDEMLDSMECTYLRFFHGDIRTWETMYYSLFSATTSGALWDFNRYINAYFNREMYGGDVSDSCYRAIYVLWHGETASLKSYLDERSEPAPDKAAFLQELLSAQERIPVLNNLLEMQRQCAVQQTRADSLEQQNRQMHKQWKSDADQWQKQTKEKDEYISYLESKNRDIESQWKADADQWQEQMKGKDGYIAYLESQNQTMEEQWKAEAAQRQKDNARWQSEKAQWQDEADRLSDELSGQETARNRMMNSLSWRLTRPLRGVDGVVRQLFRKN